MRALGWAALLLTVAVFDQITGLRASQPSREQFAGVLDEHPAIQYATAATADPVARLIRDLASGARSLTYRAPSGYLESLLAALDISVESQLLVFSKTGIQRAATGPLNPRALYFNDAVVVGYIAGARLLEIASHDPRQGVIFYTVDQAPPQTNSASIARGTNCLTCHVSENTMEVPGMIARSMFTARDGSVIPQLGSHVVDHRTPVRQRWGGWFVTGNFVGASSAGIEHLGNVTTTLHPAGGPAAASNDVLIEWLNSDARTHGYSSHDSDIAALMLFDHQMRAINLLTRVNWEARLHAAGESPAPALHALIAELADYLLFVGEAPPPTRLTPRPAFARHFDARSPKDRRGRSLRTLDLERRLMRYPCSYMIYSDAFTSLPRAVKDGVYARLLAVVTGRDTSPKYSHLSPDDRHAILEILRDTMPDVMAR